MTDFYVKVTPLSRKNDLKIYIYSPTTEPSLIFFIRQLNEYYYLDDEI